METPAKTFSLAEVGAHKKDGDCWIVVDGYVYDVSKFMQLHPGGRNILLQNGGVDTSDQFHALHAPTVLQKYHKRLCIGRLQGAAIPDPEPRGKTPEEPFGRVDVPYAEPYWYRGVFKSPYYNNSHAKFRGLIRDWIDKEVAPFIPDWEEQKDYPKEIHASAYRAGVYGACWPVEYGGTPPEGGFDAFHDLIFWDELARQGGGWLAACFLTINIALPPILAVGSDSIKNKVARKVITGESIIALAITEPYAGSDVANIRTTARREGNFFIVNGEKKFITSGMKADFFTTAVRTGGEGMGGISLLLIERDMPGVHCRKLKTQGWHSSNTAFIAFDNVKVPVENLIGTENQGFLAIMLNFNHERFAGIVMSVRGCRLCIEEAIKYARLRKTFGKKLTSHQVIRHKLAEMIRQTEAAQAWLEQLTYQMQQEVDPRVLGGSFALLKVHVTTLLEFCAREASQIFGGNACLSQGVGQRIDRIYRDVRIGAIGGGSEEIMRDLAMRQARL